MQASDDSSQCSHELSSSISDVEDQEAEEYNVSGNRGVCCGKVATIVTILITAMVVSAQTYNFVHQRDHAEFDEKVSAASYILESALTSS